MTTFSSFVTKALVDTITGGAGNDITPSIGIYRSGPQIEGFFLDCGLEMRIGGSSRVPVTTKFVRQLVNDSGATDYVQKIILKVCDPREYLDAPEKAEAVREHINRALEADGVLVTVSGGKSHLTYQSTGGAIVEPFIDKVEFLDFDTVQIEIARALPNMEGDPEDAVTAACSLVEAVCRSILIELGLPLPANKSIESLLKAIQAPLDLSPGRSDLPTEIEQDVRQVLSGLTSVTKGVGALCAHMLATHMDARKALNALMPALRGLHLTLQVQPRSF